MRVKFKDRRQFESCWLKDISAGGIFLRTQTPAALFGKLQVVLELPNGDTVELSGEVVRVVAPQQAGPGVAAGMGVQFVDLDVEKRSQLEAYLGFTQPVALDGLLDLEGPVPAAELDTLPPSGPVEPRPSRAPGLPPAAAAPVPRRASTPAQGVRTSTPGQGVRTVTPAQGVKASASASTQRPTSAPPGGLPPGGPPPPAPLVPPPPATLPPSALPPTSASGPPPPVLGLEDMVQGLRRMLWLCADPAALADADYYEVLGLPPSASAAQVSEACAVLRVLVDPRNEPPGVENATSARFKDLVRLLDEVESTLVDPGRRARYDGSRRRR